MSRRLLLPVIVTLVLVLAACGDDDDAITFDGTTTTTEAPEDTEPAEDTASDLTDDDAAVAEQADAYAREQSGGETEGCSSAAPGAEAEAHPGCVYAAAFAGCHEGITGEPLTPLTPEDEWASEPALVDVHRQAEQDCST